MNYTHVFRDKLLGISVPELQYSYINVPGTAVVRVLIRVRVCF